jgi:hypothetical protein
MRITIDLYQTDDEPCARCWQPVQVKGELRCNSHLKNKYAFGAHCTKKGKLYDRLE